MERVVFQAERIEPENGQSVVRFRYVINDSAEVLIPREWWEQMGNPDALEVAIRPFPE
jgi:hypothetical protein